MAGDAKGTKVRGHTDYSGVVREELDFPAEKQPSVHVKVTIFSTDHGQEVADGVPLDRIEEGRDFTMSLTRKTPATLRFRVMYDTGKPCANWLLVNLEPDTGSQISRWTHIDAEGRAEVEVPSGAYAKINVVVHAISLAEELGSTVLRSGDVVERRIEVERGGDLSIEFKGAGDRALREGEVEVKAFDRTETRGIWGNRAFFPNLPPGRATITVRHDDFLDVETAVDIVKDEQVEKEITVTRKE
jgi:hypothetical protein